MSGMDEVFGFMPARPDTEEFWKMSELALELDGRMEAATTREDRDRVWEETVAKHAGLNELTYLGMQRAFRLFDIKTQADLLPRIQEVMKASAFWIDAFVFGCEWKQRSVT